MSKSKDFIANQFLDSLESEGIDFGENRIKVQGRIVRLLNSFQKSRTIDKGSSFTVTFRLEDELGHIEECFVYDIRKISQLMKEGGQLGSWLSQRIVERH